MRYPVVCVLFAITLAISVSCSLAWADDVPVAEFTVGNASVWAIADSIIETSANAFPGADPQTISQYMPTGSAPSAITVFLVKIEDEIILIDTGFGDPAFNSRLMDGLEQIGVTPEQITLVLLTHMHRDHVAGLMWNGEKAFPSARVLVHRLEKDFWLDERSARFFPHLSFSLELARERMAMYASVTETFEWDTVVAPGIQAIDASPHTPGHTVFMLESEGERLLFWADLVHVAALQFPRPDINPQWDLFPGAAAVRAYFMEWAAEDELLIAGPHLPFPGVGTVERRAEGGFTFIGR